MHPLTFVLRSISGQEMAFLVKVVIISAGPLVLYLSNIFQLQSNQ